MQFNGKPLIDVTIEFAKTLGYPIYVSTDWDEFKREGVTTIPRFFGSDVDMRLVVDQAVKKIKEDNIILLQCTSPLRGKDDILTCVEMFTRNNKNLVTINSYTLKPDGYCYIFPKNRYIWDSPIILFITGPVVDIDYIWDFRIAEALDRGNNS